MYIYIYIVYCFNNLKTRSYIVGERENAFLTPRGKAVGFGRLKIPKISAIGFNCEIPLLAFIAIEDRDDGGFIATCIHLQIDGYGSTIDKAINDMVGNVWYFLRENFIRKECEDSAWSNIEALFNAKPSTNLWNYYHSLQLECAKKGIASDWQAELGKRISALEDRVRRLENVILGNNVPQNEEADLFLTEIVKNSVVAYHERAA